MALGVDLEAIKGNYDKLKPEEEQREFGGNVQVQFSFYFHCHLRYFCHCCCRKQVASCEASLARVLVA